MSLQALTPVSETLPTFSGGDPLPATFASPESTATGMELAAIRLQRGRIEAALELRHAGRRKVGIRYELHGAENAPCVIVQGGISAHRHCAGSEAAPEPGWWASQVGAGRAIDLNRYRVLAIDWLGVDGGIDAPVDCADQADALAAVLDTLGIRRIERFVGCSYGASVGLQFAARHGERLEHLLVIAGAHRPHVWALAQRGLQRRIVALGRSESGAHEALSLARQLAMLGYRTSRELAERFDQPSVWCGDEVDHASASWLTHVGDRYAASTALDGYLCLSRSLDLLDVKPESIRLPVSVIGFEEDQLVPPELIHELIERLACPGRLHLLRSRFGHDAFLKEDAALDAVLRSELEGKA